MKKELQEVLDNLGNNPIEEKELATIAEGKDLFEIVAEVWKLKCPKLKAEDFSDEDLEEFFNKLHKKVFSLRDDDGNVKYTDATKDLVPLSYFDRSEVKTIQKKINNLIVEIGAARAEAQAEGADIDAILQKINEATKKTEEYKVRLEELIYKDIDTENMTKWEMDLVKETKLMLISNPSKTIMGKNGKS